MPEFTPIGTIHTQFETTDGVPIQPAAGRGIRGTVEVLPEFADGLKDLDGFSHIILLYHFHRSEGYRLHVTPFLDTEKRGLFATRAPKRPNGIGLSIVRLVSVGGNVLTIEDVDMLDGTPLLDIKPYVPVFDKRTEVRTGWLEAAQERAHKTRSDDRFTA